MTGISAVATFFGMISNAVALWLAKFNAAGVPVLSVCIFLACFGIFERLVLTRLLNYNPASSVAKEKKIAHTDPPSLPEKASPSIYETTFFEK